MTEAQDIPENPLNDSQKRESIITVEDAAKASIVQSIAFAAQNDVDAWRNQNTVDLVAMGAAYAKWLENPVMSQEYEKIVKQSRRSDFVSASMSVSERAKNTQGEQGERLSMSIFKTFLNEKPG